MPIWVVVEADSIASAIEVLNSDPEWRDLHHVHVKGDEFTEDDSDTQRVRVHGCGRNDPPYPSVITKRDTPNRASTPANTLLLDSTDT